MALPPTPSPSLEESMAPVLRDSHNVEVLDLDLRPHGTVDIYDDHRPSVESHALQPRDGKDRFQKFALIVAGALGPVALAGGWLTRSEEEKEFGKALILEAAIPATIVLILGLAGMAWSIPYESNKKTLEDWQQVNEIMQARLDRIKLEEEEKKIKSQMKQEEQSRELDLEKKRIEIKHAEEKGKLEIRKLRAETQSAELGLREAQRKGALDENLEDLKAEFRVYQEILNFKSPGWDSEITKLFDGYPKAKNRAARQKTLRKLRELLDKRTKEIQQMRKDADDWNEKWGGKDKAELAKAMALFEDKYNEEPTPKRAGRRRRRASSILPTLIEEKNTSCDVNICHRVWYTGHRPEINKRSKSSSALKDTIHDVHITPPDFEFGPDGSLQRRGDGGDPSNKPEGENADSGYESNNDISETECDMNGEVDGKKISMHSRVLVQGGGDLGSLALLHPLGEKGVSQMLAYDMKSYEKVKRSEQDSSKMYEPGLTCMKLDLSDGEPAAWVAYTLSEDDRFAKWKPSDLLNKCREQKYS
ncbi:hypothetical protein N7492_003782 [Penicillium capsulatum]|uniref:Uncharacterized protein n=1 Tax=Penicillium capsulatum TaxID=69766 RepID=A0A9W9IMI9_9EURO|nr:hypothetical protein N7492_003782 [Penicillium capsulatum]KAJ6121635.1 hypothetical protein N7512_004100 [Penicillium capsulatum]